MPRLSLTSLALLLALTASGQLPPPRTASDERYQVTVHQRTPCCPSTIELVGSQSVPPESFRIEFDERVEELAGIELVAGDRAIVRGRLRYGGEILLIVDLAAREHEQSLWTYGSSLSPEKDLLVYQTHYPRQAAGARQSIVLLYDLRKTPKENRGGAAPRDWPQPNAGRSLFPPRNACTGSTDVTVDRQYSIASPFLFSPDGQRIVFLAIDHTDPADERSFIVRTDLRHGACAGLRTEELDVRAMIRREGWEGPFRFSTERLRWLDETAREVVAEQPPGDPYGDRVVLPVP